MGKKIFVGNLSFDTTSADLESLFSQAGTCTSATVMSFFAGWLTTELALHHLAWQALLTAAFVWAGALAAWPGVLGLAVTLGAWAGLARCYQVARRAEAVVEDALREGLGAPYREEILPAVREKFAPALDWRQILVPLPVWHRDVERVRDVTYARPGSVALELDVYRPRAASAGCPTLLQIHGGAWILGSKNEQGIPLMRHLASRGWVCVSANYRLSPRATFPDHLIDCKRAVQWIREHGAGYGANADFLVVTGGSAGGHLAALVALTANDPEYQPGVERFLAHLYSRYLAARDGATGPDVLAVVGAPGSR